MLANKGAQILREDSLAMVTKNSAVRTPGGRKTTQMQCSSRHVWRIRLALGILFLKIVVFVLCADPAFCFQFSVLCSFVFVFLRLGCLCFVSRVLPPAFCFQLFVSCLWLSACRFVCGCVFFPWWSLHCALLAAFSHLVVCFIPSASCLPFFPSMLIPFVKLLLAIVVLCAAFVHCVSTRARCSFNKRGPTLQAHCGEGSAFHPTSCRVPMLSDQLLFRSSCGCCSVEGGRPTQAPGLLWLVTQVYTMRSCSATTSSCFTLLLRQLLGGGRCCQPYKLLRDAGRQAPVFTLLPRQGGGVHATSSCVLMLGEKLLFRVASREAAVC